MKACLEETTPRKKNLHVFYSSTLNMSTRKKPLEINPKIIIFPIFFCIRNLTLFFISSTVQSCQFERNKFFVLFNAKCAVDRRSWCYFEISMLVVRNSPCSVFILWGWVEISLLTKNNDAFGNHGSWVRVISLVTSFFSLKNFLYKNFELKCLRCFYYWI